MWDKLSPTARAISSSSGEGKFTQRSYYCCASACASPLAAVYRFLDHVLKYVHQTNGKQTQFPRATSNQQPVAGQPARVGNHSPGPLEWLVKICLARRLELLDFEGNPTPVRRLFSFWLTFHKLLLTFPTRKLTNCGWETASLKLIQLLVSLKWFWEKL